MARTVRAGGVVALTVSALLALACESLLGIDEQYVMESGAMSTGGASSAGSGGTGGVSQVPGSGGLLVATGGAPPAGSGGVLVEDAGCASDCGTGDCRPGHYRGTFAGRHNPVGIAGFPPLLEVSGTVEFDVGADSKGHLAVSGSFAPAAQQQPGSLASFNATIGGELDCGTAELDAKLTGGTLTLFPLPPLEFEGSLAGSYDSTAHTVSGGWTENQIPATQATATGTGTWTATWVGP